MSIANNTISGFFGGGGGATPITTIDTLQVVATNGVDANIEKEKDVVLEKTIGSTTNTIQIVASGGNPQLNLTSQTSGLIGRVQFTTNSIKFSDTSKRFIKISPNSIQFYNDDLNLVDTTIQYSPLGQYFVGTSQRMASVSGILALNEMSSGGGLALTFPQTDINNVENCYYYVTNASLQSSNSISLSNTIPDGANFWVINDNYNPCDITFVTPIGNIFSPQGTNFNSIKFFVNIFKANGDFYFQVKIN